MSLPVPSLLVPSVEAGTTGKMFAISNTTVIAAISTLTADGLLALLKKDIVFILFIPPVLFKE